MKHLSVLEIHAEINSVLGQGTVGYLTITRHVQKQSFTHYSESADEEAEVASCGPIDRAILQARNEQPLLTWTTCEDDIDSCDSNPTPFA
jgi:hypothetical protein